MSRSGKQLRDILVSKKFRHLQVKCDRKMIYDVAAIHSMPLNYTGHIQDAMPPTERKTMDFCMHHYETCKQAEMENHELRTRR